MEIKPNNPYKIIYRRRNNNLSLIEKIAKDLQYHFDKGIRVHCIGYLNQYPNIKDFVVKTAETNNWSISFVVRVLIFGESSECKTCERFLKPELLSIKHALPKFCCSKCYGADEETNTRRNETNQERYGGNSPTNSKRVRRKQIKTMLNRHGVKYSGESKVLSEKALRTKYKNFGGKQNFEKYMNEMRREYFEENGYHMGHAPEDELKRIETIINKFGSVKALYTQEVRNKMSKIMKKIYKLNPEKFDPTSGYSNKTIKLQNKEFIVQGYEDIFLYYLNNRRKSLRNLVNRGKDGLVYFSYKFNKEVCTYRPDFYNTSTKTVYEIKGKFTLGLDDKDMFLRNKRKAEAVIASGYNFKLVLVCPVGKDFYIVKVPILDLKFSELKSFINNQLQSSKRSVSSSVRS